MTFKATIGSLLLGGMLLGGGTFAAYKKIPGHPRVNEVNHRRSNQRSRIQQGIKNGNVSKQEAAKLRRQGKAIHQEERTMRKADNGHLTRADKRALNQQQNKRSREIYNIKHDKNGNQ